MYLPLPSRPSLVRKALYLAGDGFKLVGDGVLVPIREELYRNGRVVGHLRGALRVPLLPAFEQLPNGTLTERGVSSTSPVVVLTSADGSIKYRLTNFPVGSVRAPRWSPDGSQIIYAAAPETEPGNSDIVVSSATGAGTPQVPVRGPSDDILPVFSSDSAYLAFSSNRTGAYNIFIYRISDGQLFQLTNERNSVFVGGWWQ